MPARTIPGGGETLSAGVRARSEQQRSRVQPGVVARRRDGNGDEALKLVSEAILRDGPTPDLLEARAIAYMTIGRSDAAIKDLEDAIAVRPSATEVPSPCRGLLERRVDAVMRQRLSRTQRPQG